MLWGDALAGLAAAVLSGLGVGSGGLLVLYLTLLGNYEQLTAQGINLLFFLFSSGAALTFHATRRTLYYGVILILALAGLLGAAVGVLLSGALPTALVRRLFGGMLVLSGMLALRPSKAGKTAAATKKEENSEEK